MSSTRKSGRKRAANTRISDLVDSSPSQRPRSGPKKRKVILAPGGREPRLSYQIQATTAPRRPSRRQRIDEDLEDETVNNETEEEDNGSDHGIAEDSQDLADAVIRKLDVSTEDVMVADQYNSERWDDSQNIEAFAKISGRRWTYFVNDAKIYIGRDGNEDQDQEVHIDLGPSKLISRRHASIYYDPETEGWNLSVHGRNGVRVDEHQVRKNESRRILSGNILEIGGTQMLFQLATEAIQVAPFFLPRITQEPFHSENGSSSIQRPRSSYREKLAINGAAGSEITGPASTPPPTSARPRTPEPPPKREPVSAASGKKKSPYKRGMMIESTEQIDYTLDSSKDIKPACSYASMITWAILSQSDEKLSLNGIYEWIKSHYAYYRLTPGGWQNSIRHNLSLNASFTKVPRRSDEPGKGMKWTFVPENRDSTIAAAMKQANKGGGRVASAPGTPTAPPPSDKFAMPERKEKVKTSPSRHTPPLSSYQPNKREASTPSNEPSRHSDVPVYGPTQGQLPVLSDETSPLPRRFTNGRLTNFTGSSPTLTSTYGNADLPAHTPAPRAINLSLPLPNTAKLPTSHMTPTTPAPFWKVTSWYGSTPAQWPESSPARNGGMLPLSSSPPVAAGSGVESPTRKTGAWSQQAQKGSSSFETASSTNGIVFAKGNVNGKGSVPTSSANSAPAAVEVGEEQEGQIDILK